MGGEAHLFARWPQEGDFFALRAPLCLAQVTITGQSGHPGPGPDNVVFNLWTPESDTNEAPYLFLKPETAEYLWFQVNEDRVPHETPYVIGDVWITREGRLWFVGPKTTDHQVHILAAHVLGEGQRLMSHLYQPGAGRKEAPVSNDFERLLEDD